PIRKSQRRAHALGRPRRGGGSGLGRDAYAYVPEVGRTQALPHRDPRNVSWRGGRAQERDVYSPRPASIRAVAVGAWSAPAGAHFAFRPEPSAPHVVRPGRGHARA